MTNPTIPETLKIPHSIKTAFDAYGFNKKVKLENAIATRSSRNWFGVLFQAKDGTYFAIDFKDNGSTYEIQNDYIDIADVKQFKTGRLSSIFY